MILMFGNLRQEDSEFEVSLGYMKSSLKIRIGEDPESLKVLRFTLISRAFHFYRLKVPL